MVFDRLVISVPELGEAISEYQTLMGAPPVLSAAGAATPSAYWLLTNTTIELVQQSTVAPRLQGLVFSRKQAGRLDEPLENTLDLDLQQCDGGFTERLRANRPATHQPELSVDHVVLRTDNAAACIELFRDRLGIRLALDKTVESWGGRMLFFRAGKMTLEVIESLDSNETSFFWGVAYQCPSLAARVEALKCSGVLVSESRDGRKPGTQVATLKSHGLGIPTLLIQPAATD